MMKKTLFFLILMLLNSSSFSLVGSDKVKNNSAYLQSLEKENQGLWLLTATISRNYSMHLDTVMGYTGENIKTENEKHVTVKAIASCYISAIIENQAENPATDFIYNSDDGEPKSISVSGKGSYTETLYYSETINGTLIGADIRTDNVSGSARPGAYIVFCYSDDYKVVDISTSIKGVGSYKGRTYSGEWKDYGDDYDDFGIECLGVCDPSTDKNCKITKTAKGYHASWIFSENKQKHYDSGTEFITEEITVDVTVNPYKESDKPVVTLEGCQKLAVGETVTVTATAKPEGGSFKFWVEPADLMTVAHNGAFATLTGKTPGKGVLLVEYTTPDGKTAQTSAEASCVKIELYNGGQAIPQIALYDIEGKKKSGIVTVPVNGQPDNSAELVTFEPANPGVLSALGTGSEVTIQGINTGKTSLQAKSKCGEPTGPAVEVEVVNCDDETKDRLEKMKKAAIENLVAAAKDLQGIAGSEEFEKARDELVSSYVDLLAKVGLTIISNGKTKGVVTKVVDGKEVISKAIPRAAQIAEYGSALSEIIGSSSPEQLKDNIGKTASGEAFEKIVSTQFGEAADDLLGKAGSAAIGLAEVADAANKFYNNVGQLIHHEDMIEKFQEILEKADKELKNIRNRQQLCGKQTDKPDKQEKPKAEQKTQPTEPKPSAKPTPETNKPTAQEPQTSESTAGKPTTEDEVLVDPEFPKPPSRQVGLPFEPSDCGCDKTKDLTASTVGFSTLGTGIQNLGDCVKDFSSTTLTDYQQALEELSALTDSLSTILKTDGAAFLVKAKESKPRLDAIVNRVKVYEEEGNAFLNKMEKCPESLNIGMEIFQSVEQITVDSIKTNY